MKRLFYLLSFLTIIACNRKHEIKVGVQTFNDFPKHISDSISFAIKEVYKFEVTLLNKQSLPKTSFTNIKSPRYRADSLLKFLKKIKPDTINYIIGLTDKDISTTKRDTKGNIKHPKNKYKDWGVFGLGYINGPSCVVSTFRYKTKNKSLFTDRIQKICVHEIGHNLGLPHCNSGMECVMQDAAESIRTIDKVNMILCKSCKKQIEKQHSL